MNCILTYGILSSPLSGRFARARAPRCDRAANLTKMDAHRSILRPLGEVGSETFFSEAPLLGGVETGAGVRETGAP